MKKYSSIKLEYFFNFQIGAQREVRPEPTLEDLWTWLQGMQNAPVVQEVLGMIESCKPCEGLRFSLINDLEKISGTRV